MQRGINTMGNRIIIVDDDLSTLNLAEHFLNNAGFHVTALRSGQLALDYVRENGIPDLFLLDTSMPDLDGFQTLELLKKEMEKNREVPVAFLSAEDRNDQEARGLESGAMDYIHKPFSPEVLVSRVRKILDVQTQIDRISRNAETDPLTGCLNKSTAEALMTKCCLEETGFLCVLDLDSFKSVNDMFGHDIGDRILTMFSRVISGQLEKPDQFGRIGGDEFIIFLNNRRRSEDLIRFTAAVNEEYIAGAKQILGDRLNFPIGISIGGVSVPKYGRVYSELFHFADLSLHAAKRNGKHGCHLYTSSESHPYQIGQELDLETVTAILEERIEAPSAMWIGREVFGNIYKYIVRYITRYHNCAYRVLLTVKPNPKLDESTRSEIISAFKSTIKISLRNSDVMMECSSNQIFLLLPEVNEKNIGRVISRLIKKCSSSSLSSQARIDTEYAPVRPSGWDEAGSGSDRRQWVIIVDHDPVSLELSTQILSEQGLKVTALSSLQHLPKETGQNTPDLILLDLTQPDTKGIETFLQLKQQFRGHIPPVIVLSTTDEPETECLRTGAIDFIQKPFAPDVLSLRTAHVLRIAALQRNLTEIVAQ